MQAFGDIDPKKIVPSRPLRTHPDSGQVNQHLATLKRLPMITG